MLTEMIASRQGYARIPMYPEASIEGWKEPHTISPSMISLLRFAWTSHPLNEEDAIAKLRLQLVAWHKPRVIMRVDVSHAHEPQALLFTHVLTAIHLATMCADADLMRRMHPYMCGYSDRTLVHVLERVVVSPHSQRSGVGSALVREFMKTTAAGHSGTVCKPVVVAHVPLGSPQREKLFLEQLGFECLGMFRGAPWVNELCYIRVMGG